jgi:hypothetical protein
MATAQVLANLTEAPLRKMRKPRYAGFTTGMMCEQMSKFGRGYSTKPRERRYTSRSWHKRFSPIKRNTRLHFQGVDAQGVPIWS